ncbi:MAG: PmoA family protein [Bacteroidota bacterium]
MRLPTATIWFGLLAAVSFLACTSMPASSESTPPHVQLLQTGDTVDVIIGGQLFTRYQQPAEVKKPVLYPVHSPGGQRISRGYPPQVGERVDHPHHVGIWFNHGKVNGLDFWNHSAKVKPERKDRYGTILHQRFVEVKSGNDMGKLVVESVWKAPAGIELLKETTTYLFWGDGQAFGVERQTTLQALADTVHFEDNKEGMFAIRLTRSMELAATKPVKVAGPKGEVMETEDNSLPKGNYRNAAGLTGGDVWGTRGPWVCLDGEAEGTEVAVAIFDHPANPGAPASWHARGYGLFSVNNLGRRAYNKELEAFDVSLSPGESMRFQHRLVVYQGHPEEEVLRMEHESFSGK